MLIKDKTYTRLSQSFITNCLRIQFILILLIFTGCTNDQSDLTTEVPVIELDNSAFLFGIGHPIQKIMVRSKGGFIETCTVSPSLPEGLAIDSTNCYISGNPATSQAGQDYTITASNKAGSSSIQISITIGNQVNYSWGTLIDKMNGTVRFTGKDSYSGQQFVFMKCSRGQNWQPDTNSCSGIPDSVIYCSSNDNSCDDGTVIDGSGSGTLFNSCNSVGIWGGKSNWRVPTKSELSTIVECNNLIIPSDLENCGGSNNPSINSIFPNTFGVSHWTSTAHNSVSSTAWVIGFNNGTIATLFKNTTIAVRCVSSGP